MDARKRYITSLFSAKDRQQIADNNEEEYELIMEKQRIDSVVREHEAIHPPNTEECPICLETIKITSPTSMTYFGCCGNGCCNKCWEVTQGDEGVDRMPTCPLCRADFPRTDEEGAHLIEQRANAGRSWAQAELGLCYLEGNGGYPDLVEALKWLQLAAGQRNPYALYILAEIHIEGMGDLIERSDTKARILMKESADLGFLEAQVRLGAMYRSGKGGSLNMKKDVYYSTLAYEQEHDPLAAYVLGKSFLKGCGGMSKSLYRAKHYLEEAAVMRGYMPAYADLELTLLELRKGHELTGGNSYRGFSFSSIKWQARNRMISLRPPLWFHGP